MQYLGKINNREIYYISIRDDSAYLQKLPTDKWLAFTITDKNDQALLNESAIEILKKNVSYICSTGALARLTEEYFDEAIAWRGVQFEEKTGEKYNYDQAPMTSMHQHFSEGFWFAAVVAALEKKEIDKLVCIDFTVRKVKRYLMELIQKINNGWLPSSEGMEKVEYDS